MKMERLPQNLKPNKLLSPPGVPLILAGMAVGLVTGLLGLMHSPDRATAIGLAWFVGTAIGMWIGVEICLLAQSAIGGFARNIEERLDQLMAKVEYMFNINVNQVEHPPHASNTLKHVLLSTGALSYPFFLLLTFAFGLTLLIHHGSGLGSPPLLTRGLLIGACGTMVSLGILALSLTHLRWRIRTIEQRINDIASVRRLLYPISNGQGFNAASAKADKVLSFLARYTVNV